MVVVEDAEACVLPRGMMDATPSTLAVGGAGGANASAPSSCNATKMDAVAKRLRRFIMIVVMRMVVVVVVVVLFRMQVRGRAGGSCIYDV